MGLQRQTTCADVYHSSWSSIPSLVYSSWTCFSWKAMREFNLMASP